VYGVNTLARLSLYYFGLVIGTQSCFRLEINGEQHDIQKAWEFIFRAFRYSPFTFTNQRSRV
jgi:hypothetical protein